MQDTKGVSHVHPVPAAIVAAQIKAALGDIGADVIKIGMLGTAEIAMAVADILETNEIPLVLDTVLLSSSGAPLLDEAGITVMKKRLIRRSRLVTPNLPEAEALTGIYPKSEHRLRNAAMVFKMLGKRLCCSKAAIAKAAMSAMCCGRRASSFPSRRRARKRRIHTAPVVPWLPRLPAAWRSNGPCRIP